MKVAFHVNQLGMRGTEVATFDYAHFNETLLDNESVILAPILARKHRWSVYRRFRRRFPVRFYARPERLGEAVAKAGADALYLLRGAAGPTAAGVPNLVHAVFAPVPPHGDRFAYVSEWLARRCGGQYPAVPHMVHLPPADGNLRDLLRIPADATVFGRHGGFRTFDLPFVYEAILEVLDKRPDIWFLFLNTKKFASHPRIVYLRPTPDPVRKVRFIQSCDAMLHGGDLGETFGIAIGEFSILNRPVLTYGGSEGGAHFEILGDRAILYHDREELVRALLDFDRSKAAQQNWDAHSEAYNPAAVMKIFDEVFLSGL